MEKKKLLYVSPFPPEKSGISDYSEILVYQLRDKYEITLLIDNYKLTNKKMYDDFEVVIYWKDRIEFEKFDYILYNIGNNPFYHSYIYELCLKHPGMVILHDCVLYYLVAGYYEKKELAFSKIYEQYGLEGLLKAKFSMNDGRDSLLECDELAAEFPLNIELAESGNKIMVHSEFAKKKIKVFTDHVRKINMIPQISTEYVQIDKKKLFSRYNIPEDAFVIASFGVIAPTKLNHVICQTVYKLSKQLEQKICYVMVGEGDYVDQYIDNEIIYKTGFVDMDAFDSFIAYSDLVMNLRYPSMGETSAALIKILQMGKTCLINDDGWFAEVPEECAVKIPVENMEERLFEKVNDLIACPEKSKKIGNCAKEYIEKEHDPQKIVEEISEFLEEEI